MKTLLKIETDAEALGSETLADYIAKAQLSTEDSRLARTLVFGVLRNALTLDFLYGRFLTRNNAAKLDPALRVALRLSAFQHYFLSRIPNYALVNDTVEIAKKVLRLQSRDVGFLNAVLRKVAADTALPESVLPAGNKASALSVRYSFPIEIVRLFIKKYGGQKAAEIMAHCNVEPSLTLRANTLRISRGELADRLQANGFSVEPGRVAPESLIINTASNADGKSLLDSDAFRDGLFYVQDEASQLVAHVALPSARGNVLDLCAAPGGKATHLAELTGGQVAITATDISSRRLELVRENIARLQTPAISVVPLEDISTTTPKLFDLIMVDAPCSGLGTVRRNPEIRYRITPESLARHQQRQLEVLETSANLTAANGAIVYSTCSVSEQENREVVAAFLKGHPDWSLNGVDGEDSVSATWPEHPELDGFEAVVLRKR